MELQKLYVTLAMEMKEYAAGLDEAANRARSFGDRIKSGIGGAVATAGVAAVAGLTVVSGAIAGVGAAGLNAFIGYQQQMNEVFTLLPGITDDAMSQMSDDVQTFSREFGTLPEEVVPALYQALSAGVPQDNVFSFLETAQQAAIGGVTDLETAVDGISSVVNAYGEESVNAGQASDLMFTAVRLGKTTFDELAASLFQVNPTAAALGVQFGDVTAALAGMTAQGVPTSVATTQLRQLLVELSKDGGKAAGMFQDLTGQTFAEFIASGGNVADALEIMQGGAADLGVGIQDLFGSVEAGNAALALSGPNLEGYRANIDAMANSAGATQAAYDQMDGGIGRVIDRMKAFGATALLQIGEALAPLISLVLDFAEGALPKIQGALDGVTEKFGTISKFFGAFTDSFSDSGDLIGSLVVGFQNLVGPTSDAGKSILNIGLALKEIKDRIVEFVGPIVEAVTNFVSFKDVLIALGLVLGGVILVAIANIVIAMAPVLLVVGAIIAAVALLRNAWENNWGGIQEKVGAVVSWLRTTIQAVIGAVIAWWNASWPTIQATIETVWGIVRTVIQTAIDIIKPALEALVANGKEALGGLSNLVEPLQGLWAKIGPFVQAAATLIGGILTTLLGLIVGIVKGISQAIGPLIDTFINLAKNVIEIVGGIIEFFTGFFNLIVGLVTGNTEKIEEAWDQMTSGIVSIVTGLVRGVVDLITGLWETLKALVTGIVDGVVEFFTNLYDKLVGHSIIVDLVEDVVTWFESLLEWIGDVLKNLWATVSEPFITMWADLRAWFLAKVEEIKEIGQALIDGLIAGIEAGKQFLRDILEGVAGLIPDWLKQFLGIASPAQATIPIGQAVVQGIIRGIEEESDDLVDAIREWMVRPIDQMMGTIENLLEGGGSFGGVAQGIAGHFRRLVTDPMEAQMESLSEKVSAAGPIFAAVFKDWGGKFKDDRSIDSLNQLLTLRGRLNERIRDYRARGQPESVFLYELQSLETVNQAVDAFRMRNDINAEYIRQQEKLLALEKARADLDFLKQQMEMLNLMREYKIPLSALGGVELGLTADPGQLMNIMVDVMERIVRATQHEINSMNRSPAVTGQTPGTDRTTMNIQTQNINGGQHIYLVDTEESELERLLVLSR